MVIALITSFFLLAIFSFAIYRWQRTSSNENANQALPPSPDFKGLFAASGAEDQRTLRAAQLEKELAELRQSLLARAAGGDKEALPEAHLSGDRNLYDEVLDALVRRAENEKQIFALASYIARSSESLPVNQQLAEAFIETWKLAPDRRATAEMLHVAALAGDAAVYQHAIELALQYWREGRLSNIRAEELAQLVESEFWVIPSNARNSGAGFLLKRKLASVRRELAASTIKQ